MRKTNIGVVLALALSFVLVLAVLPAAAKGKPVKPDPEPSGGTVCGSDPQWDTEHFWKEGDGWFEFTLAGKSDGACIDVVTNEAGPWFVTITGSGARYLGVIPRDSIGPGDSCGGWLLRSTIYDFGADNPLILGYDGSVPAATINACGTQFGEWVDPGLPGLVPDDCDDTDTELGCWVVEKLDNVTQPLVLQAFMRGQRGGSTTIRVDLP